MTASSEKTDKRKISLSSARAGATVTFEFENGAVPTEALAELFAQAIIKMLRENPWAGAPDLPVAMAWSMASLTYHASRALEDEIHPEDFINNVVGSVNNFYRPG